MHDTAVRTFDARLKGWGRAACEKWGFPDPEPTLFDAMRSRLPEGLRATIGLGLEAGIVHTEGHTFVLRDQGSGKGPYQWFSRYNAKRRPIPNWEYYVQVGEYVRLATALAHRGYRLVFEDDLMDIGIYRGERLIACCEVKEKSTQARRLLSRMITHAAAVSMGEPDRGDDPLRKAKYLVRKKPPYFYVVAIGARFEFGVTYPRTDAFELREDVLPLA